jgi:hypothetical protein
VAIPIYLSIKAVHWQHLKRPCHRSGSVFHTESLIDMLEMFLHGSWAQFKNRSDLGISLPVLQPTKYLRLSTADPKPLKACHRHFNLCLI